MLEEQIQNWIKGIDDCLRGNRDIIDAKEYKKAFLLIKSAKDNLRKSLEELNGN